MTRHTLHDTVLRRLQERRRFLQVLAGPRQVGVIHPLMRTNIGWLRFSSGQRKVEILRQEHTISH
jgi:hypothetical protein